MHDFRPTESAHGIPTNPFVQKQHFRCRNCGKLFSAVNGTLQENGFEANPSTQSDEPSHFFKRLRKTVEHCPDCGGKLDEYLELL